MALQGEPRTSSSIAGLPIYWQEATKPPELEWEKWMELFEVALMAKSNISVAELKKTTGNKDKSLMGFLFPRTTDHICSPMVKQWSN